MLALWNHTALDLAERSRTELVTRDQIETAWRELLAGAGLARTLARASELINRAQLSYFRTVLKTTPPGYDARAVRLAWLAENIALWDKLGTELADQLADVLKQVRLDADDQPRDELGRFAESGGSGRSGAGASAGSRLAHANARAERAYRKLETHKSTHGDVRTLARTTEHAHASIEKLQSGLAANKIGASPAYLKALGRAEAHLETAKAKLANQDFKGAAAAVKKANAVDYNKHAGTNEDTHSDRGQDHELVDILHSAREGAKQVKARARLERVLAAHHKIVARREKHFRPDAKGAGITRAVNAARKKNVGLVSDLTVKQTLELGALLKAGQEQGVRHETLIEQVRAVTGFGESRSRLIARDQTVKHNAAVQEAQARAAGITKYRWVCVSDEATRPFHKRLNNTVHSYNDPPVTNAQGDRNNPGDDFQCRCSAVPIIELFAGLSDD